MTETEWGCTWDWESFPCSACLPEVCSLSQFSVSKSSPSVQEKIISYRHTAGLDSDCVLSASRQSVLLPHFFWDPLTSKILKERKHHAVSSAFCECSELSLSLPHRQNLKAHIS